MTGNINMNGQSIINIADATNDGDAVSKKYMENALKDYLPTNGGTMNGAINMGDAANITFAGGGKITGLPTPTENADAANKEYVDSFASTISGTSYITNENTTPDTAAEIFTLPAGKYAVFLKAHYSNGTEKGTVRFNWGESASLTLCTFSTIDSIILNVDGPTTFKGYIPNGASLSSDFVSVEFFIFTTGNNTVLTN